MPTSSPFLTVGVDGDLILQFGRGATTMTYAQQTLPDLTRTSEVSGLLARLTSATPPEGAYGKIMRAAYDGRLETQKIKGRHYVPRSAYPQAAAILGLPTDPTLFDK